MRTTKRKIDARPDQFLKRLVAKVVREARGSDRSAATTRNAGIVASEFAPPDVGGGVGNDPVTGKFYWSIGDPIDDTDYILK